MSTWTKSHKEKKKNSCFSGSKLTKTKCLQKTYFGALWYVKNVLRASNQDKLHTLSLSHTEHKVHGETRYLVY